jgi:HK97 family phage portal protein
MASFFSRFFNKNKKLENRNFLDFAIGLNLNGKKVAVNAETSLTFSAVYAAVRLISETISQLPFNYYERTANGRIIKADHPLHILVNSEPNQIRTKFVFFELMVNSLLLYGNAYIHIERNQRGLPIELHFIHPDDILVNFNNGVLVYESKKYGVFDASDVIHIPDIIMDDGYVGKSRIAIARDNIALGIASQTYGKEFFESGAKVGGVLQHPGQLGPVLVDHLRQQF